MTPVQAQLIVNAPAPVTVSAPDTDALVTIYTDEILPLSKYSIETPQQFVQASLDWNKAKQFVTSIDTLFENPCKLAHQAHKALTGLREQLKAPAVQIAAHIGNEILKFRAEEDRKRRAEEQRLQAIENARVAAERAEAERIANAERERLLAEQQSIDPWDVDESVVIPAVVVLPPPPPPVPVRLTSTVPQVLGGPRVVDKPWSAEVTDPCALLRWILENPADRLIYVEFRMPELNKKAVELGDDLKRVIPGVSAFRGKTLKRS